MFLGVFSGSFLSIVRFALETLASAFSAFVSYADKNNQLAPQLEISHQISAFLMAADEPLLLLVFGVVILSIATGLRLRLGRKPTSESQHVELPAPEPAIFAGGDIWEISDREASWSTSRSFGEGSG